MLLLYRSIISILHHKNDVICHWQSMKYKWTKNPYIAAFITAYVGIFFACSSDLVHCATATILSFMDNDTLFETDFFRLTQLTKYLI